MPDASDLDLTESVTIVVESLAVRAGRRIDDVSRSIQQVILREVVDLPGDRQLINMAFVLGPLGSDDSETARLRETLQVFLETGATYKTTAEKLNIHPNTVKYRIHKAEDKLPVGGTEGPSTSRFPSCCAVSYARYSPADRLCIEAPSLQKKMTAFASRRRLWKRA